MNSTVDAPQSTPLRATLFEALGPNPTGADTRLWYTLAPEERVSVRVHHVSGRLVRNLELGSRQAGSHEASWDGRGDDGAVLRTGLYFVTLGVGRQRLGTRRLVIQR